MSFTGHPAEDVLPLLTENPARLISAGLGGASKPLQWAINSNAGQQYLKNGLLDVTPQMALTGDSAQRYLMLPTAIQAGIQGR